MQLVYDSRKFKKKYISGQMFGQKCTLITDKWLTLRANTETKTYYEEYFPDSPAASPGPAMSRSVPGRISVPAGHKHGTIVKITHRELDHLLQAAGQKQ
jgi:hypothetical protein